MVVVSTFDGTAMRLFGSGSNGGSLPSLHLGSMFWLNIKVTPMDYQAYSFYRLIEKDFRLRTSPALKAILSEIGNFHAIIKTKVM